MITRNEGKAESIRTVTNIEPEANTTTVRASVASVFRGPEDPTQSQILKIVEHSLGFWANEEEDIYSLNDGEPI